MNAPVLALRTAFRTSRALDYVSVQELSRETGQGPAQWPVVIAKELIDNPLDATQEAGLTPAISVTVDDDGIEVRDNGPGTPPETVEGAIDFTVRASSRAAYVAPDRGQQGHALKVTVSAPFALDGAESRVDIAARGLRHSVALGLDELHERPEVSLATVEDLSVRIGTTVRVHWPESASSIPRDAGGDFYRLVAGYILLNPHAALTLRWFDDEEQAVEPSAPDWTKWRPSQPTSAHWYPPERLARLIAAYLAHDRDAGAAESRTVRDFVGLFAGLSGTAKQKAVLDATGLHRAPLRALLGDDGLDMKAVTRLLRAMQAVSRPVKPEMQLAHLPLPREPAAVVVTLAPARIESAVRVLPRDSGIRP